MSVYGLRHTAAKQREMTGGRGVITTSGPEEMAKAHLVTLGECSRASAACHPDRSVLGERSESKSA